MPFYSKMKYLLNTQMRIFIPEKKSILRAENGQNFLAEIEIEHQLSSLLDKKDLLKAELVKYGSWSFEFIIIILIVFFSKLAEGTYNKDINKVH